MGKTWEHAHKRFLKSVKIVITLGKSVINGVYPFSFTKDDSVNYKGVCRTSPATPGLLVYFLFAEV